MKNKQMRYWPKGVPVELVYRLGKKPLHVYLRENASSIPDKVAYIFYGKEITWAELNDRSNRVVNFLQTNDIKKGDKIGIYMKDCPQYVIAYYAIQKLGATVIQVNPTVDQSSVERIVQESCMKAMIVSQDLYPIVRKVRKLIGSLSFVITTNYVDYLPLKPRLPLPEEFHLMKIVPVHTHDLFAIFKEYDPIGEEAEVDFSEDIALIAFEQDDQGKQKGVMFSYENDLYQTAAQYHIHSQRGEERWLSVMSLSTIAGMTWGVHIPIFAGITCVLLTRFEPQTVLAAIETYQCTNWYSDLSMNLTLLEEPEITNRNVRSLTRNVVATSNTPLTEELSNKWKKTTGNCQLYQDGYGITETHFSGTFMPMERIQFGSCGIPSYDTTIRIVCMETGNNALPGESGEIVIKNPGVFKGYLDRPDKTKKTLKNGWIHTGHIGRMSEDGYLYIEKQERSPS